MARNTAPNPYVSLGTSDWWEAADLRSSDQAENLLSEEQVRQYRETGFIVIANLWPAQLIEQACHEVRELHPAETIMARIAAGKYHRGFSEMPWVHMGDASPDIALNHMTVHPRALSAVAQLMQKPAMDLRLSQSHVIAKVGKTINRPGHASDGLLDGDQDVHVDYGNNTLMVPPRTSSPDAVACLAYYSDVDECGGATHFTKAAPGELTTYEPSAFNPPNFVIGTENGSAATDTGPRSPDKVAQRYADEKPIRYRPGTCVLYSMNTWHRGTPVNLGTVRYTHHHVWRHRYAEWVNWQSLTPRMAAMPTRFLSDLTVVQRSVLGFAAPGDAYWTEETLNAVGQRYPEMEMAPYRAAMGATTT